MSEDSFGQSPWGDAISSNPAVSASFAGLNEHIVNELSNTFAQADIHKDDSSEDLKTETSGESALDDSISRTSKPQALTENDHSKGESKDAGELLSTLTAGDSLNFIKDSVKSPKRDEALFHDPSKSSILPDAIDDQDNSGKVNNSLSSPSKVRRQNIYKAPRLRRNPLKTNKIIEEATPLDIETEATPLGPLGVEREVIPEQDTESAAERLSKEFDTPLFQINRTPLSPLKPKPYKQSSTTTTTSFSSKSGSAKSKVLDEEQELEQAKLDEKLKEKSEPAVKLKINVGDPIRVGDITSAHIVYSVRTKTDSDLFRNEQTVVSRRYRDFRWLYRQLQATHPGRIIPPPPDKQAVGRFNEEFIEGRRLALERMLVKIGENIHLQKDPDFLMFLQSERFSSEAREREKVAAQTSIFTDIDNDANLNNNSGGFLSSIGGAFSFTPKATEPDEYFRDKRAYIESLDQQLKIFLKNLENIVLQRHDLAVVTEEFSNIITTLSDLEISKVATDLFQEFSNTQARVKELLDRLSLQDMLTLGSTLDEYQRVISSIRTIFQQREKVLILISNSETELKKKQASLDKHVKYSSTQTEKINLLKTECTALEQKNTQIKEKYQSISSIIKEELATFEVEKIHDFRNSIEIYLASTIESQKEAVELWETFYDNNLATATS